MIPGEPSLDLSPGDLVLRAFWAAGPAGLASEQPLPHPGRRGLDERRAKGRPGEVWPLALRYVAGRLGRKEFRPATAVTYRDTLWDLARFVGTDKLASQVTRRQIERWMAHGRPCSEFIRQRLSVARNFFSWTVETRVRTTNPCDRIKSPKTPRPVPRNLQHEQVADALAEAPDVRSRLILILEVQLGLRAGEVAALELGDLDLSRLLLTVRSGKGGYSARVLPITVEAREAIGHYLAEYPAGAGRLLRSYLRPHEGISARHVGALAHRCLRDAGVGGGGHQLRHTAATDALDAGANIRMVQTMLGHATLQTTERYLAFTDAEDLRPMLEGRRYGRSGEHGQAGAS